MVNEPLLSPETYDVLSRIPPVWWDEDDAVTAIAQVTTRGLTNTRRRLARLIALNLVERRKRNTIAPATEILKIGK